MNQMSWTPQVPPPPPPSPVPPPMPVAFSGNRGEFFASGRSAAPGWNSSPSASTGSGSSPTSAAISGPTPWSMAMPPEYTGRGKELLIGFLVALAILVPIYLGYFLDRPRGRAAIRRSPAFRWSPSSICSGSSRSIARGAIA